MNNLVYYAKDNAYVKDAYGKRVLNPVPRERRQRRQTIAGVIVNDKMYFGRAECQHTDIFSKKEGKEWAERKALDKPLMVLDVPKEEKNIVRLFIKTAKALVLPEKVYDGYEYTAVCLARYNEEKIKRGKIKHGEDMVAREMARIDNMISAKSVMQVVRN